VDKTSNITNENHESEKGTSNTNLTLMAKQYVIVDFLLVEIFTCHFFAKKLFSKYNVMRHGD